MGVADSRSRYNAAQRCRRNPNRCGAKNGSSVGDSVTVTKRSATTGIYDCSYDPAGEAEGDSYTLEERAQVTGTTTAQAYYDSSFSVRVLASITDAVTSIKGADGDTLETLSDQIDGIDGGGATVTVLPATGIVADRSPGVTLLPVIGETISQAITLYQLDGTTAVNLSGKTLAIIFETMSGVDVAVVANADITVSGASSNVVTFAYPSAVTASERVLRFAIRDAAAPLTMYLQGICSVVAAPKVDA